MNPMMFILQLIMERNYINAKEAEVLDIRSGDE